jgi:hypothetical protein
MKNSHIGDFLKKPVCCSQAKEAEAEIPLVKEMI